MGAERRRTARRGFRDGHLPPAAKVRPGLDVVMVNLSTRGALIESPWRFRPGSRCELAVTVDGREVAVSAFVARCYVARLDRGLPIRYRAALAFEGRIELPARSNLLDGYEVLAVERPGARRGVVDTRRPQGRTAGGRGRTD